MAGVPPQFSVPKFLHGLVALASYRRTEITEYWSANPAHASLIRSTLPAAPACISDINGANPLPDPDYPKHQNAATADGTKRKRRYVRARVAVDDVVDSLLTVEMLSELRRSLREARMQTASSTQTHFTFQTRSEATCKEEVTEHLSALQTHFDKLRLNKHFETVANRYQAVLIVQFFDHLKARKTRRYSLAELFTSIVFKDWVRQSLKSKTEQDKKAAMRKKRKSEVHGFRFWLQLSDAGRLLDARGRTELRAKIDAYFPNLKEDLGDVSYLVRYFVSNKKLPERKLLVETLDQGKVSAMEDAHLRELLRFVSEVHENPATSLPALRSTSVVNYGEGASHCVDASTPVDWQNEWSEYFSASAEAAD
ncbi:hypothetical protein V2A60_008043 [Cordyceps javanica]